VAAVILLQVQELTALVVADLVVITMLVAEVAEDSGT
tara:strand:+ start:341 stop:451 length:111 start_codon:yes stop_codon:yes gene_type:complete